jgi:predicted phage terminase large subunit-like protein
LSEQQRKKFLASLTPSDKAFLQWHWAFWARKNQLPPDGEWFIWLYMAGRGAGKTRSAAEWIRWKVETEQARRIALVGRTAADVRDVMVRGESGVLACCPAASRPVYEPSKRLLTWPNGAIATCYSADEPDLLRGPQHDAGWADEVAAWNRPEAWDNLLMGMRLGVKPQICASTTPKPVKIIRELVSKAEKDSSVVITRGSTYDNRANLAPSFFDSVVSAYAGTRIGRQEIGGELLLDTPGALWRFDWIADTRVDETPELQRVVVAVDPATTHGEDSDETGLAVVGKDHGGEFYVLHGEGVKLSPQGWANRALDLFDSYQADRIIAERNNGGEMVEHTLRTIRPHAPVKTIHASRGKQVRAEPCAALYEQRKVHHVGSFPTLEDQMCRFPVATDLNDQVDALVYALSELSRRRTITFA